MTSMRSKPLNEDHNKSRHEWNELEKTPYTRPWMKLTGAAATSEHQQSHVIFKALVTGGVTGGIELLFAYPLEYLKTQLQFEAKAKTEKFESYNTLGKAAKATYQKYGLTGFYRGMGVMMIGNIPKAASRFGTFETVRQYLGDKNGQMSAGSKLIGGLCAGVVESIVAVAPMETIKVKVIHDKNRPNPRYRGSFHSVYTILREEGIRGTYQGLTPTILKQMTNQGSRFVLMETFKERYQRGDVQKRVPTHLMFTYGIITSFFTVYLNSPIDLVKTRMQGLERKRYKNSWDCAKQVFKEEGLRGFYKGSLTRALRMCIDTVVSFTMFDAIMDGLSKLLP